MWDLSYLSIFNEESDRARIHQSEISTHLRAPWVFAFPGWLGVACLCFLLSITVQWLSASCMPVAEDAEHLALGARSSLGRWPPCAQRAGDGPVLGITGW